MAYHYDYIRECCEIYVDEWLDENLVRTRKGYLAYKTFGCWFAPHPDWNIEEGSEIKSDHLNRDVFRKCGCGINVSTREWQDAKKILERGYDEFDIWEVLIPYDADIVIPYRTDGKFRCDKITLLKVAVKGTGNRLGYFTITDYGLTTSTSINVW